MSGAGAVVSLVLLEWTVGSIAAAAWTQSWTIVRRGHFRIVAWCCVALAALAYVSLRTTTGENGGIARVAAAAFVAAAVVYLLVQYSRTDLPGTVIGAIAAAVGIGALVASGKLLGAWPLLLAAIELVAGAALLGGVTNGMLLGHWYLNQPGLKPWALARLTALTLGAAAASAAVGLVAASRLAGARTDGAALGLVGFGNSFGGVFYAIWLGLVVFTGVIVWAAHRCIRIRSIQSATGLYYVALLCAGVAEFLVRYLMVHSQ